MNLLWSLLKAWCRDIFHGQSTVELYKLAERAGAARLELERASEYHSPQELAYMKLIRGKVIAKPRYSSSQVEWTMLREVI